MSPIRMKYNKGHNLFYEADMPLDTLQKTLLQIANEAYPARGIISSENGKLAGYPDLNWDDVPAGLKDLENDNLIEQGSIRVSAINEITITGDIEITSKGRNYLKQN